MTSLTKPQTRARGCFDLLHMLSYTGPKSDFLLHKLSDTSPKSDCLVHKLSYTGPKSDFLVHKLSRASTTLL